MIRISFILGLIFSLYFISITESQAGLPSPTPTPTPTPTSCSDCTNNEDCGTTCEFSVGPCFWNGSECVNTIPCCYCDSGCDGGPNSNCGNLDEPTCEARGGTAFINLSYCAQTSDVCPVATPAPTPAPTFHQVGGSVMGTSNTIMCCSFYSDVCAPCGNPAQGYIYQTPNACDNALDYENLWLRCKDPKCNKLTKGSYTIQICHLDGTTDPSDGTGTEVCTQSTDCTISPGVNHCDFDDYTDVVEEGETIYLKITPSKPSPNAPLKALWTGLVNSCTFPSCGDGNVSGLEVCDGSNLDGKQCTDLPKPGSGNYAGGDLACASDCTFDTSGCYYCGDGNLNPGELCDDGSNNGPNEACSSECEQTYCGDNLVQNPNGAGTGGTTNSGDEECDDGNLSNDDACNTDCTLTICGDGTLQTQNGQGSGGSTDTGDEECDDGNQSNNDDCLNTCVNASCGDGYAWTEGSGNEGCDDPEFPNGTDCTSYSNTFCGGSVLCTNCQINTAVCQLCSPECEVDGDCPPGEACFSGFCEEY